MEFKHGYTGKRMGGSTTTSVLMVGRYVPASGSRQQLVLYFRPKLLLDKKKFRKIKISFKIDLSPVPSVFAHHTSPRFPGV